MLHNLVNVNITISMFRKSDIFGLFLYKILKNIIYRCRLQVRYNSVLKFIHANVGDMRTEFIVSAQRDFIGYYCFYGSGVLSPITINEFLHYIHSYIINNEIVFIKYYIPKNNKEMINELKVINVNKVEFAIGNFQTIRENFAKDLCYLMNEIPTDFDIIDFTFNL